MVVVKLASAGAEASERYPPPSTAPPETWRKFMLGLEAAIRSLVKQDEERQWQRVR